MTDSALNTAALWESWRRLYPVYCVLAREQVIDFAPCPVLEEHIEVPSAEIMSESERWFGTMDERIRIHHLRQFAQSSDTMTEQALSDLIRHILAKKKRTDDDHDQLDFSVVQLLSFRIPSRLALTKFSLQDAASFLEPIVGATTSADADFVKELDELIAEANAT